MFQGAINELGNRDLDAAELNTEIRVGDRTNWVLPAIWPRIKWVANEVRKPFSFVAGLAVGGELKTPKAMPLLPETFQKNQLGSNLAAAYKQECEAAIATVESRKCLVNFDITGYRERQAIAVHQAALNKVALPEETRSSAASVGIGATLGSLIPADITKDLVQAAAKKVTTMLA